MNEKIIKVDNEMVPVKPCEIKGVNVTVNGQTKSATSLREPIKRLREEGRDVVEYPN